MVKKRKLYPSFWTGVLAALILMAVIPQPVMAVDPDGTTHTVSQGLSMWMLTTYKATISTILVTLTGLFFMG